VRHTLSFLIIGLLSVSLVRGAQVSSTGYEVLKVNHELIDLKGETHEDIGDLVNRAKYQNRLKSSGQYKGIRFFVHWKAAPSDVNNLLVKIEARGFDAGSGHESTEVLTQTFSDDRSTSGWTTLDLSNEVFKKFGKLMAWRVSLWRGSEIKTSRVSFTWDDSYSSVQVLNQNTNPSPRGL
jgi:hypothetical protein